MSRIKNTSKYVFDNNIEGSSFLIGSDEGDSRITKSYRISDLIETIVDYGYIKDAPNDGESYIRKNNGWETIPTGSGSVFSVFGRTGSITGQESDYSSFYSLTGHTHSESDITDLQDYLLPSDIGTTVQAWSSALDSVTGVNTGDQDSIVGISGTKAQFNSAVTDGSFLFVGDAPTAHTHVEADITDLGDYLESSDINTLSKINSIITGPDLIDTNDIRLSDSRTPTAHTHVEADITDLQSYLLSVDISDINATGTASSSTFLRGDGVWATVLGGVSSVFGRTADVTALSTDYDDFYYTETEVDGFLSLKADLSGATFTGDIEVPEEAYGASWNGSLEAPTKNSIYDKLETIAPTVTEGTWTPVLTDKGGGATYSYGSSNCRYSVFNDIVSFTLRVDDISTTGTPSGIFTISLPFDADTPLQAVNFAATSFGVGGSGWSTTDSIRVIVDTGSTNQNEMAFYPNASNVPIELIDYTNVGSYISITGSYFKAP